MANEQRIMGVLGAPLSVADAEGSAAADSTAEMVDRTRHGVPLAATIAARGISLVRVRARTANTDSWRDHASCGCYELVRH